MEMTITEALAEVKTIEKRINKKTGFISQYVCHPADRKDPLEKEGGSEKLVAQERQALNDLQERLVNIRTAIQKKNLEMSLTLHGQSRTVAEWLIWRRDISKQQQGILNLISTRINSARQSQQNNQNDSYGRPILRATSVTLKVENQENPEIQVNLNESKLAKEQEQLELILGDLDGKLSLLNAVNMVEVK